MRPSGGDCDAGGAGSQRLRLPTRWVAGASIKPVGRASQPVSNWFKHPRTLRGNKMAQVVCAAVSLHLFQLCLSCLL